MLPDLFQDYFSDSTSSHSYTTQHASKNSLFIPRYTTTRTQQSFKYIDTKIWNDIPQAKGATGGRAKGAEAPLP